VSERIKDFTDLFLSFLIKYSSIIILSIVVAFVEMYYAIKNDETLSYAYVIMLGMASIFVGVGIGYSVGHNYGLNAGLYACAITTYCGKEFIIIMIQKRSGIVDKLVNYIQKLVNKKTNHDD